MTASIDQLADRHFRPDPYDIIGNPEKARTGRVLIRIGLPMALAKAGQDALWMLANLLARQFRLVTGITVDIPNDVALVPRVAAFGEALSLKQAVMNCVRLVAGTHVAVTELSANDTEYDVEITVGRSLSQPLAPVRLTLYADGWRFTLGSGRFVPDDFPVSSATIAPYMAACFAAGEVFKRLRGIKSGKGELITPDRELLLSLWSGQTASSWRDLPDGPKLEGLSFPPFYLAGAGAVAQAKALTVAGLPDITGYATVIDYDHFDLTNDNRYGICTLHDGDKAKAPFLAEFLSQRGIVTYPYEGTWQNYITRRGRNPNRTDLDELEARYLYRIVLSCVDDNGARQAIQNIWPEIIIGGSTHGLTAKAITYDMAADQLCLKCYNPVTERNERVRQRLEQARALSRDARAEFFRNLGIDPERAEQHLQSPRCGQLSEDDLDRFAAGEPMMSVGFVSVAAGVLLAAQFLRFIFDGTAALVNSGASLTANFYRPGFRWVRSSPQSECNCVERRITDWRARWCAQ